MLVQTEYTVPSELTEWDLKRVLAYLIERKKVSPDVIAILEREYKRFIAIRLARPDVSIVPSLLIDEFWHAHILFTREYLAFCKAINDGKYIHHMPFLKDDKLVGDPSMRKTLRLYRELFGQPPASVWPTADSGDCETASCGKCSSSNCGPQCSDGGDPD